jgi:hypothetical protein
MYIHVIKINFRMEGEEEGAERRARQRGPKIFFCGTPEGREGVECGCGGARGGEREGRMGRRIFFGTDGVGECVWCGKEVGGMEKWEEWETTGRSGEELGGTSVGTWRSKREWGVGIWGSPSGPAGREGRED